MRELDIGEVARRSGLAASALRHYEQMGLIAPVGRHGLRRVYAAEVLETLALVALGRAAGLSLQAIGAMLGGEGGADINRDTLVAKAVELDRRITQLAAIRDGLRHAAACPAPSHLQCPRFRALLRRCGAR